MKKLLNINTILIGAVFLVGIIGIFLNGYNKTSGGIAIVQVNSPEQKIEIDLSVDKIYTINAPLEVTLEVKNNSIAFINSHCPDKKCEGYGYIHIEDAQAICLPAGVVITIYEASK